MQEKKPNYFFRKQIEPKFLGRNVEQGELSRSPGVHKFGQFTTSIEETWCVI